MSLFKKNYLIAFLPTLLIILMSQVSWTASSQCSYKNLFPKPPKYMVSKEILVSVSEVKRKLQQNPSYKWWNDYLRNKEVLLTFDDGPYYNPYSGRFHKQKTTEMVLATLAKYKMVAHFFILGRQVDIYKKNIPEPIPDYSYHRIGSHTYTHENLKKLSLENAYQEFATGHKKLEEISSQYSCSPLFRFPFLSTNLSLSKEIIQQNVLPMSSQIILQDIFVNTPEEIIDYLDKALKKFKKGSILLHDTRRVTATHLNLILDFLNENNYQTVYFTFVK